MAAARPYVSATCQNPNHHPFTPVNVHNTRTRTHTCVVPEYKQRNRMSCTHVHTNPKVLKRPWFLTLKNETFFCVLSSWARVIIHPSWSSRNLQYIHILSNCLTPSNENTVTMPPDTSLSLSLSISISLALSLTHTHAYRHPLRTTC